MKFASVAIASVFLLIGGALGYWAGSENSEGRVNSDSLGEALQDEDLQVRSQKMAGFLETLGPGNLDGALEDLTEYRVGVIDHELRIFMLAWTQFDAPGALEWAQSEDGDWSGRLSRAAIYAWGFRDPQAAQTALRALEEKGQSISSLETELMAGWRVSGDVAGATNALAEMGSAPEREKLTGFLVAQIGKQGPEAIIAWADAIPEDATAGFKQTAFQRGIATVAKEDPGLATQWYGAHRGQRYSERALAILSRRWVDYHNPEELFEFLGGLPPLPRQEFDPEQIHALGQAMKWWLRRDPDAAQAWVAGLEEVPAVYDPALASLSQFLLRSQPDLAVEWAEKIQDLPLRNATLVKSAGRWIKRDKEAADAWLASADVPENVKAEIRENNSAPAKGRRSARPRAHAAPAPSP